MAKIKKMLFGAATIASLASESLIIANAKEHVSVVPTTFFGLFMKTGLRKKQQKINGPCWAFAVLATLETALAKKGILNKSLSEKHLLNWANREFNKEGWHIKLREGGDFETAGGYLISGAGPVFEKAKPYSTKNQVYSSEDMLMPVYTVKGIKEIEKNIDDIKSNIEQYGAVCVQYFDEDASCWHAVSIIGWDDENSSWLVKDSSDNSSKYYKTLPYSTAFRGIMAITEVANYSNKEKIYQHDEFGTNGVFFKNRDLTVCNVYNFEGLETLKEVTVGSNAKGCTCSVYYTSSFCDGKPSEDIKDWVKLKEASVIPYDGYVTYSLDTPLKLSKERGAVIVKIENKSDADIMPNIKVAESSGDLKILGKPGQCYLMRGNEFIDIENDISKSKVNRVGVFSIKAVTEKT